MDNRKIGIIIIVITILMALLLWYFRFQYISFQLSRIDIQTAGECIHEGATCPYEEINKLAVPTFIGIGILLAALGLGIYLVFFEKSQKALEERHKVIVETLKETKKKESDEERFSILLKGLNEDEQKVIKAVKEQDGIGQNTLRLRTDISKTKLSVILSGLEKKDLIKKVKKGKINLIYLKKKI